MELLKKIILKLFNYLGYDVFRIQKKDLNDLSLYYSLFDKESVDEKKFYNIGAGSFHHPAWTNVDHESAWYRQAQGGRIGVPWNLLDLKPIDIQDNHAEIVYSSHTAEHITDDAAQNLFNEAYRILKPGGIFRLTMPNINLSYKAFKKGDRHFFYWQDQYSQNKSYQKSMYKMPLNQASVPQLFLAHFAFSLSTLHADGGENRIDDDALNAIFKEKSTEDALNYICSQCSLDIQMKYPGNHINWWNEHKAKTMLEKAGFQNVNLSAYGQSSCAVLRNTLFFDNTHPKNSLYMESIKT